MGLGNCRARHALLTVPSTRPLALATSTMGVRQSLLESSPMPPSTAGIPHLHQASGCITQNCTIKATGLTASTSYWVFFLNKLPEAVKIFTVYATGKACCFVALAGTLHLWMVMQADF